jgi:hypothetical protein
MELRLVIHGIPKKIVKIIKITVPLSVREDIPIKICFPVENIQASRESADALGGQISPKNKL